ncbi:MAG: acetate--CoA ligase family protein [Deltaproteobacteria bacterium]|nr:acetate--CoA ligase family protein [Deltaproteobacteria bacterium]MBI3390160.1 acetate--CoA ligase family protein [Deltaproteobacteria bacterium]
MSERALNEIDAKALLRRAGVSVIATALARTPAEARAAAERLGCPAAVKIVSPDIVHKSDVGGVRLNLATPAEVEAAAAAMLAHVRAARPDAQVLGVAVQPMAPAGGVEIIVGVQHDPQFGPVIMFGLGGVLVEVFADVVFRLIPLTPRDARQMVREIRGARLLGAVRGRPPVNMSQLEQLLLAVSALVEQRPDIVELDLNPVLAYPDRVIAVDARALLRAAS